MKIVFKTIGVLFLLFAVAASVYIVFVLGGAES